MCISRPIYVSHHIIHLYCTYYYFYLFSYYLDSTPSPQHEKDPSSSLLAQMHKYQGVAGGVAETKHPHALQFPPPMQYMGMSHMSHLSPWQLAAH